MEQRRKASLPALLQPPRRRPIPSPRAPASRGEPPRASAAETAPSRSANFEPPEGQDSHRPHHGSADLDAAPVPETRVIFLGGPTGPCWTLCAGSSAEAAPKPAPPGAAFPDPKLPPPLRLSASGDTRKSNRHTPAPSPDTEPEVFRQLRERPLDTATYEQLADFFSTPDDTARAALIKEIVGFLAGREGPPRAASAPAHRRRTSRSMSPWPEPSENCSACAGIAQPPVPAQGRAADASGALRAVAAPAPRGPR